MRGLARARSSVRLRVTLLAAGLFAVTLGVAALGLLHTLERDLVGDVRSSDLAALRAQATQLTVDGVPKTAVGVPAEGGTVFELSTGSTRRIVVFQRASQAPAAGEAGVAGVQPPSDVVFTGGLPVVKQSVLGVTGDLKDYNVSSLSSGDYVLATASPLDSVRQTIATTRRMLWLVGPALVALVAGLAWLLAGRALRPVHAVTSRVAAIGSRSLHERVPVPASGDEIAELATTMNGMLARLELASTSSRRLVSDASHELRTPVTVMRAELDVARRSAQPDWVTTGQVLDGELDRLQGLVDDLLLLARGDEQAFARSPFSIADAVRDVGARTRRVPVDVDVGADVDPVVGDAAAVGRALDHLVANAARHATSEVHVAVVADAAEVRVDVDDDGPGIPPGRRGDVVRRFVRLDEGRARDGGGAGLGLAVTSDVATAHGGRLDIGEAPIGGARLTLVLPRPLPIHPSVEGHPSVGGREIRPPTLR
jgi:signal transduction histidine kinase